MLYVLLEYSNPVQCLVSYSVLCCMCYLNPIQCQSSPPSGLIECIMLYVPLEYSSPVQHLVSHSVLCYLCYLNTPIQSKVWYHTVYYIVCACYSNKVNEWSLTLIEEKEAAEEKKKNEKCIKSIIIKKNPNNLYDLHRGTRWSLVIGLYRPVIRTGSPQDE